MLKFTALSTAVTTASLCVLGLSVADSARAFSLRSDLFDTLHPLVNQERLALDELTLPELDPTTLQWVDGAESVDVFFLDEGAGFRNQLLFSVNGGELQTIFDDIASVESILPETQVRLDRRQETIAEEEAALGLSAFTADLSEAERAAVAAELETKLDELEAERDSLDLDHLDYSSLKWNEKQDLAKSVEDNQVALDELKADANANAVEIEVLEEKVALGRVLAEIDAHKSVRWKRDDLARELQLGNNGLGAMALGDGARLGSFEAGTQLDFFIRANGARNPNGRIYGADASQNADGLQHVIAYEYFDEVAQENYVIIGFEDLYGAHYDDGGNSDRDFNDVVFAVRGVTGQRVATAQTPEPTAVLGLVGIAGLLGLRRGDRQG